MHKELNTVLLIRDFLVKKKVLNTSTNNIDQIHLFFEFITNEENAKKFNSLYILNYIHQFIVSDDVAKRKTSARVFEDLLANLFNGTITDSNQRKNLVQDVPEHFALAKDKIAGNKREKIDLLFEKNYGVSVKTLMESNSEINLGSFDKQILYDGFDVGSYLNERRTSRDNTENIGLGSKPQLKNLFLLIKSNNFYNFFSIRFKQMFEFIFADDIIIAIKDSTKLELYFFTGKEFTDIFTSRLDNIDNVLKVLNRWEGNSIRIDRSLFLESCKRKSVIDLSVLDDSIINTVNNLDYKLHENYVRFFNQENNSSLKNEILSEVEQLFENFEKGINFLR